MASQAEPLPSLPAGEASRRLAGEWRKLRRAATLVAVLMSPAVFLWLSVVEEWSVLWAAVGTFFVVIASRGLLDLAFNRAIPWPSLFGSESQQLREEDVVNRRRAWFWRFWVRTAIWAAVLTLPLYFLIEAVGAAVLLQMLPLLVMLPMFVLFNFLILFGPLLAMGVSQIRGFEPGDAEWGVKLADVRGQAEAKEEVRRVVTLWQSGEAFERAGGKRERGLLFLGAPGTGKTMLAKAIATGFNSPFVSIPGSGFAQTFIGVDAIIVRYLAAKAKRLARKWGGTCIVFIDEIDAVGMRRQSLGTGVPGAGRAPSLHDFLFFGPQGAITPTGDLVVETAAWRERLFAERAPSRAANPVYDRIANFIMPGGMGGMGQLALNQLLVVMDGIDNPPFLRRVLTSKINTFLDATYVIPRRLGKVPLRLRPPRPRKEQIYFIGATNVPIERLDPALVRPGRMGRHVHFRTPTKQDRLDVFDLYLGKVAHDADLDRPERRDELARITNGYSPAMIDQICSMALTIAHHTGREQFEWDDLLDAMTTIEAGTAIDIEPQPEEIRATAIHEAGHAVAAHMYLPEFESTRLSVRMRGQSLGHHQTRQKQERFSRWHHEEMGSLVHILGAMAAEHVFYGENSNGVGGDLHSATAQAALMVGAAGMGPAPFEVRAKFDDESEEETRKRVLERFERIGVQLMNRTSGGGPFASDPISSVLSDRDKRATAARILGQAYVTAFNLMQANRDSLEKIADAVLERREIYGDELVRLLDGCALRKPEIDLVDEGTWPRI